MKMTATPFARADFPALTGTAYGDMPPQAQRKMLRQSHVGHYAHAEAWVPGVGVAEHRLFNGVFVFGHLHHLWTEVLHLYVLQVKSYVDAKMQGAQVDVRLVLHLAFLAHGSNGHHSQDDDAEYSSYHVIIITSKNVLYYVCQIFSLPVISAFELFRQRIN